MSLALTAFESKYMERQTADARDEVQNINMTSDVIPEIQASICGI